MIRRATGQVVPRAACDSSMSVIGIFRQLSPATRIPDVFETLDPATDTLCRIAMRLIFKFVVFLRIGVFYCLCC